MEPPGTARSRARARRSLGAVQRHVASCLALINFGSSKESSVRGRRLRAWRLYELRRVARLYGRSCCARRDRARRLAGPARRGTRLTGAYGSMPPQAGCERGLRAWRPARVRCHSSDAAPNMLHCSWNQVRQESIHIARAAAAAAAATTVGSADGCPMCRSHMESDIHACLGCGHTTGATASLWRQCGATWR